MVYFKLDILLLAGNVVGDGGNIGTIYRAGERHLTVRDGTAITQVKVKRIAARNPFVLNSLA